MQQYSSKYVILKSTERQKSYLLLFSLLFILYNIYFGIIVQMCVRLVNGIQITKFFFCFINEAMENDQTRGEDIQCTETKRKP